MKIDWGTRVGITGAILTLFGIAAFYLWPGVKAIGWGCVVAGIFVLVAWAILEIRSYYPVSKLPPPATESAPEPSQSAPGKGKPTAYAELQKAIEKVSAVSSDWTTGVHKCESDYWRYTNRVKSGTGGVIAIRQRSGRFEVCPMRADAYAELSSRRKHDSWNCG